ncbi:hypothetical protein HMPREF9333_01021 [Johnsonella ignava ATCC 51276]|uniref:Translation initiation factor IF-2 N-terminal domain-containing protein n=1 Tax=Johnsonella ignava ATCC 51276 TaxID=679200 RepID=G5GHI1_9FIRM|nr:translation initiation factor IF-2 N-terminal domain-containing protein [Johnsonella ignava]EHI55806.1 hypothetical protein HMPREF9333_01021 [Johnsonella ignava ATCC 51276]
MRIRELAKELDIQSKVILEILEKKGVTGKTPASNISGDEEEAIRNRYKTSESDKQKDIETALKTKDETVLKNKNNETSKTGIKEVSSEIKDEHSDIKKTAESTSENVQNQENISKGDISIKTDKVNAGYKTDNVLAGQKNKIMAVFRPQNAEKSIGQYQKETDKKDENRRKNKKIKMIIILKRDCRKKIRAVKNLCRHMDRYMYLMITERKLKGLKIMSLKRRLLNRKSTGGKRKIR